MSKSVRVFRAGLISYSLGLKLQKLLSKQNVKEPNEFRNYLIVQEHFPVYTIGIRNKGYDINEETRLRKFGADFHRTNRGGLITFHGPGQLVAYPIIHLQQFGMGMRVYVATLEQLVIETCKKLGVEDATTTEHTGVWVNDRKICAIGVHGSRYITSHGIGLNCCTDLKWFEHITPCGIEGKGVTSLSSELGRNVSVDEAIDALLEIFQWKFNCHLIEDNSYSTQQFLQNSASLQDEHSPEEIAKN